MVINVTSLAARLPLLYGAAYSAAKAALSIYTATLQMEEDAQRTRSAAEGERVRFIDLQPGDIRTGFNRVDAVLERAGRRNTVPRPRRFGTRWRPVTRALTERRRPRKWLACIRRLVLAGGASGRGGPLLTCGNFWQAGLGPLACRFLPPRLLLWVIRQNSGL